MGRASTCGSASPVDGMHHWRAYSITSDPDRPDGLISITPKLVEAGRCRPTSSARPGPGRSCGSAAWRAPSCCPTRFRSELLFVSAGSGITPIMSMLRSLDREGSLRTSSSCIPRAPSTTSSSAASSGELDQRHRGFRLHEQHTRQQRPHGAARTWRPVPGLARARGLPLRPGRDARRDGGHWEQAGGDRARLHMERFQPIIGAVRREHGDGGGSTSSQRRRGRADGNTPILVAGEQAGASLPFGCRMGICHTCVGCLCSGQIRDLRTGEVQGTEGEMVRTCINAPEGAIEISCDPTSRPDMSTIESPMAHLTPEQIEGIGRELDAIHDEVFAELGDRDRRYIVSMIEMHRRLVVLEPGDPSVLAREAGLDGRDGDALAGQDPREHGDRPQRDARPVGLDERPADQLVHLGLGLRLDAGGLEALPQLRAPHVHQHPRQGQRPRLRDHANRPAPEVESDLPASSRSTTSCWRRSSSGASRSTTSTWRRSGRGRSPSSSSRASSRAWPRRRAARSSRTTSRSPCSARLRPQVPRSCVGAGERPLCGPGATRSGPRWRPTSRRTSSATCGPT